MENDYVLEKLRDEIMSGEKTVNEICIENFSCFFRYRKTLERIQEYYYSKLVRPAIMPKVTWYYGPTGTGKTHTAMHDYNRKTVYLWRPGKWQNEYKCQKKIIIDNVYKGTINYYDLLKLTDKWQNYVSRRHKSRVPVLAETIIITSLYPPWEIFSNEKEPIDKLLARIEVIKMEKQFI